MGSSIIIYGFEIFILLFFGVTRNTWEWHLGMFIDLLILPWVLEGHWIYLFKTQRENEIGRVNEHVSWIALRDDMSNPLYAKGCFRKNYNKNPHSKMAKLKGHYFCQIVAIIQMIVILIRVVYIAVISVKLKRMGIIYDTLWPDIVILSCVVLNAILALLFNEYYNSILKQVIKKNITPLLKERKICRMGIANDHYKVFSYKNDLSYKLRMYKVSDYFEGHFSGVTEIPHLSRVGKGGKNLLLTVDEDKENNKVQILIQLYCLKISREDVDELNKTINKELKSIMKSRQISFGTPCVTYIVWVEEISDAFVEMFCGEIQQRIGFFCLPIGIVLNPGKLYVPGMRKGDGYEEYLKMKNIILDVLKSIPEEEGK